MKNKKVLACASTGIAATLLKHGMTAHSALYIPKELNSESRTRIGAHTEKGQFLNALDLLIIDEVSMLHKEVLKYIDRTLRTIKNNDELFGGVTVLIGGDWKQLTPVVPRGQPSQVIEASVKSWEEFVNVEQLNLTQNMRVRDDEIEFVEELRQIGNGELQKFIPGTNSIQIDEENVVQTQQDLIDFCFEPAWLQYPTQHIEKLCGSAILCPTNTVVQQLNEEILNNMQGEEQVFTGIDTH
uniref:ATP-dependent DNA helicase n=1 Tax=Panagrolaimus superbus TaxID=310955 RepID=A0A914YJA8_9BILA